MNSDLLIDKLQDLLNSNIDSIAVPYVKGKSVRIKNYVIRQSKGSYIIFDCSKNQKISQVNFKLSAIAIAKCLSENNDQTENIKNLDQQLQKHCNDVVFYKNIIKNSSHDFIKETRKARLAVSSEKIEYIKQCLEEFIFQG